MSARLRMAGMAPLLAGMRAAPERLRAILDPVIGYAADTLTTEVIRTYPARTGELRSYVSQKATGRDLSRLVVSEAHYADEYDYGTPPRQNRKGANRGRMPRRGVFRAAASRARRQMWLDVHRELRAFTLPGVEGTPEITET